MLLLSQYVGVLSSLCCIFLSVCHNPSLDDEFVKLECFMSWFLDFAENSSGVDYLMFSRMWDRVPTIFLIRIGLTFLAMQFSNCSSSNASFVFFGLACICDVSYSLVVARSPTLSLPSIVLRFAVFIDDIPRVICLLLCVLSISYQGTTTFRRCQDTFPAKINLEWKVPNLHWVLDGEYRHCCT